MQKIYVSFVASAIDIKLKTRYEVGDLFVYIIVAVLIQKDISLDSFFFELQQISKQMIYPLDKWNTKY